MLSEEPPTPTLDEPPRTSVAAEDSSQDVIEVGYIVLLNLLLTFALVLKM